MVVLCTGGSSPERHAADGTQCQLHWDRAWSGRGTGQTLAFQLEQSVLNWAASPSRRQVTWHLPCARRWAWSGFVGTLESWSGSRVRAGALCQQEALPSEVRGPVGGTGRGSKPGGREGPHARTSQRTDPFFSGELNIQSSVNWGFFSQEGAAGGERWRGAGSSGVRGWGAAADRVRRL